MYINWQFIISIFKRFSDFQCFNSFEVTKISSKKIYTMNIYELVFVKLSYVQIYPTLRVAWKPVKIATEI